MRQDAMSGPWTIFSHTLDRPWRMPARTGGIIPGSSTSLPHACALALVLLATVLLATALQSAGADAQERARIEIVPQIAHADDIASATLTPDGAQMLTAGKDGTLKLWDLATTRLVRTYTGHRGAVTA